MSLIVELMSLKLGNALRSYCEYHCNDPVLSAAEGAQPWASLGGGGTSSSLIKRKSSASSSGANIDMSSGNGGGGGGGQAAMAVSRPLDRAQGSDHAQGSDLTRSHLSGGGTGGLLESLERASSAGGRSILPLTPPSSPAVAASPPPAFNVVDRSAKGLAAAMSSLGAPEPQIWREVFRFLRNPHKVSDVQCDVQPEQTIIVETNFCHQALTTSLSFLAEQNSSLVPLTVTPVPILTPAPTPTHYPQPAVLAMCRPDKKKNVLALVKAFGESPALRHLTNLVLVLVRSTLNPQSRQEISQLQQNI